MGDDALMQQMIDLFRAELALCKVGPGQKLAVLSEGDFLREYSEAFLRAGEALGADTVRVNVAGSGSSDDRLVNIGKNSLGANRQAMATLKDADMVVDLMLLLFSAEQLEIQAAGTRMLLVVEPLEILQRLFPTEAMRRRVEAGERRMRAARTLRFTNRAGTDVTYEIAPADGPAPNGVLTEYGYTDTPGRWDHWPSGFLATTATATGVNGRVVMDAGDILLPQKEFLQSRIAFTIRDGQVTDVSGGEDARRLNEYIERFGDPRAYAISHIGWGLNEDALWRVDIPGICMDGRARYGNVLFSTGPNSEFGGDNDTACHLDLPMANCSLWLDDELIVKDGAIVPEDMRAPGL